MNLKTICQCYSGLVKSMEKEEEGINLCFIDVEKGFDKIKRDKLTEVHKEKRVDWKTEG